MPNGIHPLTRRGTDKSGICGVCGTDGPLSRTHLPPQCAGNHYSASPLVTKTKADGSIVLTPGHSKDGGAAGYLLCAACNKFAGDHYDSAFHGLWAHLGQKLIVDGEMPPVGNPHILIVNPVDPGGFVRSLLSGMMGFTRTLRDSSPVLQVAVQHGTSVKPPDGLFLLMSLYSGPDRWVAGGGGSRFHHVNGVFDPVVTAYGELAWPPFYFLLTDDTGRRRWPTAFDILPWLIDEPGVRREVALIVPVISRGDVFSFSADLRRRGGEVPFVVGPAGERIVAVDKAS